MFRFTYKVAGLFVLALLMLLILSDSQTVQAGIAAPSFEITGVNQSGCADNAFVFDVFRTATGGVELGYSTIVQANGLIYMDEYFTGFQASGEATWLVADANSRGLQTGKFPMPPGVPFTVTITLIREGGAAWETYVEVDGCDTGNITYNQTYPTFQLVKNGGFETQGANKNLSADWNASPGTKRICEKPSKPANTGLCAHELTAKTTSSNLTQKFSRLLGQEDNSVYVYGYFRAKNLNASASLTVKIKYLGGGSKKVTLPIDAGTYEYTFKSDEQNLERTIKNLKTTIVVQPGTGSLLVDNVGVVMYLTTLNRGVPRTISMPTLLEATRNMPSTSSDLSVNAGNKE